MGCFVFVIRRHEERDNIGLSCWAVHTQLPQVIYCVEHLLRSSLDINFPNCFIFVLHWREEADRALGCFWSTHDNFAMQGQSSRFGWFAWDDSVYFWSAGDVYSGFVGTARTGCGNNTACSFYVSTAVQLAWTGYFYVSTAVQSAWTLDNCLESFSSNDVW